jgi:hypothetical protein
VYLDHPAIFSTYHSAYCQSIRKIYCSEEDNDGRGLINARALLIRTKMTQDKPICAEVHFCKTVVAPEEIDDHKVRNTEMIQ